MELLLYAALTAVWWFASLTVLLPFFLLLRFNKTIRDRWFSFIFSKLIAPYVGPLTIPNRKQGFEMLEQHLGHRDKSIPLEILEIGIGSGANLKFYPENTNLTAVDMNASFEKYFDENKKKHSHVNYKRTVITKAEHMPQVLDASMDVVVCTHVMCSVEDIKAVLKEVRRVLKPGGQFLFIEHVAFPKYEWGYTLQKCVAPLWKIYCDGCCPDRDIGDSVKKGGFSNVEYDNVFPPLWLYIRPNIVGIATK